MARYFSRHSSSVQKCLQDKETALELGSGNGYLSVCLLAALMGEGEEKNKIRELVVTDVEDHLPLIEKTLKSNSALVRRFSTVDSASKDSEHFSVSASEENSDDTKVIVTEHKWGEFHGEKSSPVSKGKKFDFIFGSDLAYRDHLHRPLIKSLQEFSHDDTVALIGVTMNDTKPKFFTALNDAGFRYERLADHLMDAEFRGNTFGLIAIQRRKRQ
eukprot:CAMPEP_0195514186 /NCGR_PEP_ID=MMETSP0794_2-20130614/5643_1 /TAXON_ID=515487 /ORGANISM="Stephanopyxis turris, Strain CCMP 815" /LENGTH=214 /DNA_ID=CAMNT_0040642371 /DNA_START=250 /DNA_END=894 /DNA_ORIENTATION=-